MAASLHSLGSALRQLQCGNTPQTSASSHLPGSRSTACSSHARQHQLGRNGSAAVCSLPRTTALLSGQRLSTAPHAAQRRRRSVVTRAGENFYSVLGVDKGADKKAIKSAYRQKARKFHPDVNKEAGAEEKFKTISNAYEVLSDDNKREIYDRYGEDGLKQGMGGGGAASDFNNPFDIFEQFFGGGMAGGGGGGGRTRTRAQAGEDRRHDLTISFEKAVFGCSVDLEVDRMAECSTCSGSGSKAGTSPTTCSACGGSGQVVSAVRTPLGMFQQVSDCQECSGTGERSTPCQTCSGDGRVRKTKRISMRIPAGVDTDSRLRVREEGNSGRRGGPPGDLFVFITVKKDPELKRDGTTIHSDVEINYVDAILGVTTPIRTVDGQVDLKIPSGTQPGTTLVMNKRGVPRLGSSTMRGDHQVHVKVKIPTKLKPEERTLVEDLKQLQEKRDKNKGPSWPFGGRK